MVEIRVGRGDEESVLTAHQKLLMESPFLAENVTKFSESGRVSHITSLRNSRLSVPTVCKSPDVNTSLKCLSATLIFLTKGWMPLDAFYSSCTLEITRPYRHQNKALEQQTSMIVVNNYSTTHMSIPLQKNWAFLP